MGTSLSPTSPLSLEQRKWSGIMQQLQDSSAQINPRRRQSTEAADAVAAAAAAAAEPNAGARSSLQQHASDRGMRASLSAGGAAAGLLAGSTAFVQHAALPEGQVGHPTPLSTPSIHLHPPVLYCLGWLQPKGLLSQAHVLSWLLHASELCRPEAL
jgi:hypothetical protein